MEVLIVLIVVGIIGYLFYQSLPNPKYQKACSQLDLGDLAEAKSIILTIFEKHPDAPAKLAECLFTQGKQLNSGSEINAIQLYNEAIEIKKRLPINASKNKYELVEAKAYFEIATIKLKSAISIIQAESKVKSLKENLRFIETATKTGIEKEFTDLRKKHLYELTEIYFAFGIQCEKSNKLLDAIQNYSVAKDYASQSSNSKVIYSSSARIGISKLKNRQHVDANILDAVSKTSIDYRRDFFFRYAKKLLQDKEYLEAEKIISNHLNFPSTEIDKLKNLLKAKKIKDAIKKVNEINYNIDQLYENSFKVDDVKHFYENLDKTIDEIKTVIPTLTDKLRQLKPSLFNRLLTHYISEGQFGNAIVLIQKYPSFWESIELLKNLGICCFGYTAQGKITEKNYQTIISNWLTTAYCDSVFLKSLEETAWDDEYTFSLLDAIGSNYQQHKDLPGNVNYYDLSDSNVSIGATQRELLQQFENLLHQKITDDSLLKIATDFYMKEKEAIQKVVKILDTIVFFPSPYFAKTYNIHNKIIEVLDIDFKTYSNEEALQAGIPYFSQSKNIVHSDSAVYKYATANEMVLQLIKAIENENLNEIKNIVADKQKSLIAEFETINETIEDSIYNSFTLKIKKDDENEGLIPLMNECIRFTNQNDKLKFQYSNYVADLCISKVNDDKMTNFKALSLMKNAYLFSKENARICKNIITLIRYNLSDYLNNEYKNINDVFATIEIIRKNISKTFSDNNMELRNELKQIDDVLKSKGSSVSKLISKHYTELNEYGIKLQKVAKTYLEIIK